MPLTAYLNNTRLDENLVTNATGHVTFTRNFNPGQDRVAYVVQVAFEGTGNHTTTLNATDFMDNPYPVCQTVQFTYRPSTNTTTIVVEPQATDVTGPSKTPEEMQREAEDEGWLTTWHEFTWWYPWYRMHFNFTMNGVSMHLGFNPILPSGAIVEVEGLGNIIASIEQDPTVPLEELTSLVQEMLESAIIDVLAVAVITLAAFNVRFPGIAYPVWLVYSGSLLYLGHHATQDLYNAGSKNAGRALMAGMTIGLASVFLTTILTMAILSEPTLVTTNVIFAVIGALVENSYDPQPTSRLITTLVLASLAAIATGAIALRTPEPIGNAFLCLFLITTVTALGISGYIADTMG
jgi:hypothetical protein